MSILNYNLRIGNDLKDGSRYLDATSITNDRSYKVAMLALHHFQEHFKKLVESGELSGIHKYEEVDFLISYKDLRDIVPGISHLRANDFEKYFRPLAGLIINTELNGEFYANPLFTEVHYLPNKGLQFIINPRIWKRFNLLNSNYYTIMLPHLKKLKKQETIKLYQFLKQRVSHVEGNIVQPTNGILIPINYLREMFNREKTYREDKTFLQKVVKPALAQINEHTDLDIVDSWRKRGTNDYYICFIYNPTK